MKNNLPRRTPPPDGMILAGRRSARVRAFTLVELLVTISIAALVITSAILALGALQRARETANLVAVVDIGSGLALSFYDLGQSTIQTWNAPSFGRRALADEMRDVFLDDVAQSTAVFALAREAHASLRPNTLAVPIPAPRTPDEFRAALVAAEASADTVFSTLTTVLRRSNSSDPIPVNSSIFLIGPSSPGSLNIRAIYEIDFVEIEESSNNPVAGIYATARRYVSGSLTFFYDVFYPADEVVTGNAGLAETRNAPFSPVARYFSDTEGSLWFETGRRPRAFYFFWWPDPGAGRLNGEIFAQSLATGDPRQDYPNMGRRTAFFLAVPQFPSQ
jgi:type II secretory pathway pseudopilin PulG